MTDLYMYIDETGDLGEKEKSSKYFIITALWIKEPRLLYRLIKNIRRGKFKKELKKIQELKANNTSPELRRHILKKFNETEEVQAHSIILDKKKLFSKYLKNNKHKLYNYVCGALALTSQLHSKNLLIRVDRSKNKQILRDDFNQYIQKKLQEKIWNCKVKVYHSWSHSWSGLQMVDFVSWATFRKLEYADDSYFKLIEKKVNVSYVF